MLSKFRRRLNNSGKCNISLSEIDSNTVVILKEICKKTTCNRKLKEMGLTKGLKFRVISNEKNGPILLNVRGSKLAIDHKMSDKITVDEVC